MGWSAARKLRTALTHLARVLAVELLTAARGIDLRSPPPRRRPPVRCATPGPAGWARRAPIGCWRRSGGRGRAGRRRDGRAGGRAGGGSPAREPAPVRALRGPERSCRAGPRRAPADAHEQPRPRGGGAPQDLVVYGGTGKARSWEAFDAIVAGLRRLEDDETLLVQSGKPVAVFRTHEWAPRVLIANANLVPEWATWDEFRRLEALGLTMYGQMTAGSWIYIGTQGILQGTYECFSAIAERRFGGQPGRHDHGHGRAGGHGGAQPLAVTMNGGVAIVVEVDPDRMRRRLETRYLDAATDDLDDALARAERPGPTGTRCRSACSATPPRCSPSWWRGTSPSTSSPTRRPPTTRSATCRPA